MDWKKGWILGGLLMGVSCAPVLADEHEHAEEEETPAAKIRIWIGDADRNAVSPADVTVTVQIVPTAGERRVLRAVRVGPQGDPGRETLDHGGQVEPLGDSRFVEFFVNKPHAHHGEHGEEGSGEGEHGEHEEHGEAGEQAHAYFEVPISLIEYACPMNCVAPLDEPGRCSKCGMALVERSLRFEATVVVRLAGVTLNASGFRYPTFEVPDTYAGAMTSATEILERIEQILARRQLEKVHMEAEKLVEIAGALPELNNDERVHEKSERLEGLLDALHDAADEGEFEQTRAVLDRCIATVAELRAIGGRQAPPRGGHGHGH